MDCTSSIRTVPSVREFHPFGLQSKFADYTAGEEFHLAPKQHHNITADGSCQQIRKKVPVPPEKTQKGMYSVPSDDNLRMETPYVNPNIPSHAESTERTAAYPADAALAAEYSALENPLVLAARAFEYGETVVLAVLTEPIYLSSDRAALKTLLKDNAEKNTGKSVAVSFDLEVYRRISRDMSDGLKTVLLKRVLT